MTESIEKKTLAKRMLGSRTFRWGVGILAVLTLVLYSASYLLDEPLRRTMENKMNRDLAKDMLFWLEQLKVESEKRDVSSN